MKGFRAILSVALTILMTVATLVPVGFAASGDLAIYAADVTFSTNYFYQGTPVRIWASVSNNSEYDLLGSVIFSDQNGQINGNQPISVLSDKTDDVFVDWTPAGYGTYTITVTAYPTDTTNDDPSNNSISKIIYVEQDSDRDGIPNAQDEDLDGDGVNNEDDLYPEDPNEWQDSDGDDIGDNADPDDDNDGVLDEADDFPTEPEYAYDQDGDGTADQEDEDLDGDGVPNKEEIKNGTNAMVADTDGDGVNDGSDHFPTDPNEWNDQDGDGIGDKSDDDIDGDGLLNEEDPTPRDSSPTAKANQDIYLAGIGDEITFDASSSKDDGSIVEYIWNFNGKSFLGATVTKSFDIKGLQTASLTVIDDNGQSDTVELQVRVIDYKFLFFAILFALLFISLAFYLIYRYNRRAPSKPAAKKVKTKKR